MDASNNMHLRIQQSLEAVILSAAKDLNRS